MTAKAEVEKVMASDPRRISEINMKIYMPAKNYSDKEKVLIEKIAHHCPVGRSLNADLKETMEIIWS